MQLMDSIFRAFWGFRVVFLDAFRDDIHIFNSDGQDLMHSRDILEQLAMLFIDLLWAF